MTSSPGPDIAVKRRKTFGEKMRSYLEKNSEDKDVMFVVGPDKKEIRALRIAMKAASPSIEKLFRKNWDTWVSGDGDHIPLPNINPEAFQVFLELLFEDDMTSKEIEAMKLSPETLFHLMDIAREFKMGELEEVLHLASAKFYREFPCFVESEDFLELSRDTLTTILSSELIPLNEATIFKSVCKWGENQCSIMGKEPNGENLRQVLGPALFQIRLPLMSNTDFVDVVCTKDILTDAEEIMLFKYISLSKQNKEQYDPPSHLNLFNTNIRKHEDGYSSSTVNLFKDLKISEQPFSCQEQENSVFLQINEKITLESVGFLGPVESDGLYEATVEVFSWSENGEKSIGKTVRKLRADRRKIFHVSFDEPIPLKAATYVLNEFTYDDGYYSIDFKLKGVNTQSVEIPKAETGYKDIRTEENGVGFYCRWNSNSNQLAEIRFQKG